MSVLSYFLIEILWSLKYEVYIHPYLLRVCGAFIQYATVYEICSWAHKCNLKCHYYIRHVEFNSLLNFSATTRTSSDRRWELQRCWRILGINKPLSRSIMLSNERSCRLISVSHVEVENVLLSGVAALAERLWAFTNCLRLCFCGAIYLFVLLKIGLVRAAVILLNDVDVNRIIPNSF